MTSRYVSAGVTSLAEVSLSGPGVLEAAHQPWYELTCSWQHSAEEMAELDIKVSPCSICSTQHLLSPAVVLRPRRLPVPAVGAGLGHAAAVGGPAGRGGGQPVQEQDPGADTWPRTRAVCCDTWCRGRCGTCTGTPRRGRRGTRCTECSR